jgi:hypothetical protein
MNYHKEITALYLTLCDSGKTWADADSNVVETLWDIAATQTKASFKAKAVLSMLLDTTFQELIENIPDTSQQRLGRFDEESKVEEEIKNIYPSVEIRVYPNPAKDEIIFEFSGTTEIYHVQILDTAVNNSEKQQYVFSLESIVSGIYMNCIGNDKNKIQSGRLVIIK